jgi:hypothetical protein
VECDISIDKQGWLLVGITLALRTADSSAALRNDKQKAAKRRQLQPQKQIQGFFAALRMTTFEDLWMEDIGEVLGFWVEECGEVAVVGG